MVEFGSTELAEAGAPPRWPGEGCRMRMIGNTVSPLRSAFARAPQAAPIPLKHAAPPPPPQQPKLLDRLREALRSRHYSRRTEQCYWQWVFPQGNRWVSTRTGAQGRHHVHESIPQKAVKAAVRKAGIPKHATCHTFRPSGVYPALCGTTHLLEAGYLSAVPACASPHLSASRTRQAGADRPSTAQAGAPAGDAAPGGE